MPTLAVGSKPWHRTSRGFTLLELLVVLAIVGVASGMAVLALPAPRPLQRDAERLQALLESQRAQARASGQTVFWQSTPGGFVFLTNSQVVEEHRWLDAGTRAHIEQPRGTTRLSLGPETVGPAIGLRLYHPQDPQTRWVFSDGFHGFATHTTP